MPNAASVPNSGQAEPSAASGASGRHEAQEAERAELGQQRREQDGDAERRPRRTPTAARCGTGTRHLHREPAISARKSQNCDSCFAGQLASPVVGFKCEVALAIQLAPARGSRR